MNENLKNKGRWKRLVLVVPLLIAVAAAILLVRGRKGPEKRPEEERAKAVRVIEAKAVDVAPRVTGYGYAEPGQVWKAVSEVGGKIVEAHPSFEKGGFLRKDEILLRIDPAQYELNKAQMEAGIESIRARLAEISVTEKNIRLSLDIEKKSLELKKKNLERNKKALSSRSVSELQYDQVLLEYQTQLAKLQDLENSLNLIPTTRGTLAAELALNQAKLAQAELDLEHAAIRVPFPCRITEADAEIGQFVQKGQQVGSADGVATAEISARLPMEKMARLLRAVSGERVQIGHISMERIRELFDLKIKVRIKSGSLAAEWDAEFARADATIDPRTRTVGVIVVVRDPYEKTIVGVRPPLVRNMFCEVEISGRPVDGSIVVPRTAVREGLVFVADSEDRLKRRKVAVDFFQEDFAAVSDGICAGERVVVSDPVPAIEGMLLAPEIDRELARRIFAQAEGKAAAQGKGDESNDARGNGAQGNDAWGKDEQGKEEKGKEEKGKGAP